MIFSGEPKEDEKKWKVRLVRSEKVSRKAIS